MRDVLTRYQSVSEALPEGLAQQLDPHTALVRARQGQTLVSMGSRSTSVYFVLEGRVQVAVFSLGGREVILRDLKPGALFGELGAMDDQPRSASIVALSDCLLAAIPGDIFRDAVCASPPAALWMTRRLVSQVRNLTGKVFELNTLRVPSRLHCELLRLSGAAEDGVIDPFPTHEELAARIGTHREAVTREMRFLTARNILVQARRRTVVTDRAALAALVRQAAGDMMDLLDGEGRAPAHVARLAQPA